MSKLGASTTDVICMDTGEQLRRVTRIDVEQGVVWRQHWPPRLDLSTDGDVMADYPMRFRSVYPIYAGSFRPYLVHCYGRQP